MKLSDIKFVKLGEKTAFYHDQNHGTCQVIACHPEDGALLIVELIYPFKKPEQIYYATEACYLKEYNNDNPR